MFTSAVDDAGADESQEGDFTDGYVAPAVARRIRHQLLGDDLRRYEEEHGGFSDEEMAEARSRVLGASGPPADPA
ncbi:hypothetical protein ACFV0R_07580 [Streptomyces sp. NPDC059578]|uniref:hypothetical protein n=1 Tax=Streptomyces sp. NPDC059578 TaxID=3346874 RepID=UPI0036AA1B24